MLKILAMNSNEKLKYVKLLLKNMNPFFVPKPWISVISDYFISNLFVIIFMSIVIRILKYNVDQTETSNPSFLSHPLEVRYLHQFQIMYFFSWTSV